MDYQPNMQPAEQTPVQPSVQQAEQAVEQGSSAKVWYVVVLVATIVIAALAYFAMRSPVTNEAPSDTQSVTEQTTSPTATGGNTTSDITNDLGQIPDASSDLDADASAVSGDLNSL